MASVPLKSAPRAAPHRQADRKPPTEQGDAGADIDGFRRSLGEFATGVTVITTRVEGMRYGMTSNSFASVSLKPPLVLWSIRRESQSFSAFESCTHFAVNVLAIDQMDLSQRFARSGPDKFDTVACREGAGASPVLDDVAASFECRMVGTFEGGDHLILLGQVERYARYERQPLLFSKGRYAVAADHPASRTAPGSSGPTHGAPIDETLLAPLLVRAYGTLASRLEKARSETGIGLTLMQARLLKAAETYPESTLEELLPELLLDFNASQDVLDTVIALGLLAVDDRRRVRLTQAGVERIRLVVEHTRESEEVLLRNVPNEEIETTKRVLRKIVGSGVGD